MMILDMSSFEKAIVRLEEGLARYQQNTSDAQIRDGLIQRFEFTYELSHKMLKRYLALVSPTPEAYDSMPFQALIRTGNEHGLLLGEWAVWRVYREMRSKTSHTYDENVAELVVASIPAFLAESTYLCEQLKARLE